MMIFAPVAAIAGGIGRRVAGGALGQWFGFDAGDTGPRLFFGATIAASAALATPAWEDLLFIPAVFVGCTIPNFNGIALGRDGTQTWLRAAAGLLLHGTLGAILPAAGAWWFGSPHWWTFLAAGAAILPAYEIGWRITGPTNRYSFPIGFQQGSEIGEAIYGAGIGLAAFFI